MNDSDVEDFIKEVWEYFDTKGFSYDDYLSGRYKERFDIHKGWEYFKNKYGEEWYELYDKTTDKIYRYRLTS